MATKTLTPSASLTATPTKADRLLEMVMALTQAVDDFGATIDDLRVGITQIENRLMNVEDRIVEAQTTSPEISTIQKDLESLEVNVQEIRDSIKPLAEQLPNLNELAYHARAKELDDMRRDARHGTRTAALIRLLD